MVRTVLRLLLLDKQDGVLLLLALLLAVVLLRKQRARLEMAIRVDTNMAMMRVLITTNTLSTWQ